MEQLELEDYIEWLRWGPSADAIVSAQPSLGCPGPTLIEWKTTERIVVGYYNPNVVKEALDGTARD